MRHFLSIRDLNRQDVFDIISLAKNLKAKRLIRQDLKDQNILLLFEKPSLRTRVSFEVAIRELSGNHYYLGQKEVGFGKREAIKDIAAVLSRYVQAVIIRTFKQENLEEFAKFASISVVNALTDSEHPCQVVSDLLTMEEKIGRLNNFKVAFIGDGNNVCNSLLHAAAILGFDISVATPKNYEPSSSSVKSAMEIAKKTKAKLEIINKPDIAVKGADFIYTDVWASMGWEGEKEKRSKVFKKFQLNKNLLKNINKDFYIMHCLPAHRGEEITDDVIDSKNSIVIDQAENRLHTQKAILVKMFS